MNHVPKVLDRCSVGISFCVRVPVFLEAGFPRPLGSRQSPIMKSLSGDSLDERIPVLTVGRGRFNVSDFLECLEG